MRFDILTLFPDFFDCYFKHSIPRIAQEKGLYTFHIHDMRQHAVDKRGSVDNMPYGGGPGMVLRVDVVVPAVEEILSLDPEKPEIVLLTPQGKTLSQSIAQEFASCKRLLLVCGHYEGFDARIAPLINAREVSVGDYVLSGGETAALVILDAAIRLLPGALGDANSTQTESFSENLLEYPQYTRPAEFRGNPVPEVLRSGHHAQIDAWRKERAIEKTQRVRGDLLEGQASNDAV